LSYTQATHGHDEAIRHTHTVQTTAALTGIKTATKYKIKCIINQNQLAESSGCSLDVLIMRSHKITGKST
jgi:hypothetical protein